MKKPLVTAVTAACVFLIGCGHPAPFLFGKDSCNEAGKAAYVTADGASALCLPEKDVTFMMCVRELGLSKSDRESSAKFVGKLGELKAEIITLSPEVSTDIMNKIVSAWEKEGDIASARARAIDHCVAIAGPR